MGRIRERDAEYSAMVKGMTLDERRAFGIKWRKENKHIPDIECSIGKAYRGTFTDLDALIKLIGSQDDHYGICEDYYTYLLIERHEVNRIDDTCWGEEGEIWYKATAHPEDFRYMQIDKPECFKRTCNFT